MWSVSTVPGWRNTGPVRTSAVMPGNVREPATTNPERARAITRRAAVVASGDRAAVEAAGAEFAAAGSACQGDRTRALAQRMPPSGTPE